MTTVARQVSTRQDQVSSDYGYVSGYSKPKPVHQQIKIIHELFPEIKWGYFRPNENEIAIPEGAEGLFAIPRWQKFGRSHLRALTIVLHKLNEAQHGRLHVFTGSGFPSNLKQRLQTRQAWERIYENQDGHDIMLVPAQFGLRNRGRSVSNVNKNLSPSEFSLDCFAVAVMLLTHPERLQQYEDLSLVCGGDQLSGIYAPLFYFNDGRIKLNEADILRADEQHAPVTGFIPE